MRTSNRKKWLDFSAILKEIRRTEKWGHRLHRHPVFRIWEDVAGIPISKVARPVGVKGGCLRVEVAESVWMQELQLMEKEILKKLNAAMEDKDLKSIQFRLGNSFLREDELTRSLSSSDRVPTRQAVAISVEDETTVREILRDFRDEELRDRVESLLERTHSQGSDTDKEEKKLMNLEERG